jgi:hypothetical protein
MDVTTLRAIQAPLKDRYRSEPDSAVVTLRAHGSIDESKIACKVETGRALAIAGLHPASGGSGAELCSGDMLLEALVACAGVTLKAVATALEIPLKEVRNEGGTNVAHTDTLDLPFQKFEGDDFLIGAMHWSKTFQVTLPPHLQDKTWRICALRLKPIPPMSPLAGQAGRTAAPRGASRRRGISTGLPASTRRARRPVPSPGCRGPGASRP